ncbi:MAG: phage Gp19/Gp15/Gp42 family protein [Clostridia bacterium]|nr:phage Gp19/Gp15/Gp42 family protein [Clostridiales bacterium]MDU7433735.1 phage Gp19/Gp15/Gp42 family protein [Anaerococcus vaginalis]MDU7504573.1 phage Gp19/Gp15/Gp42 family protein [Clostridia bacterium]
MTFTTTDDVIRLFRPLSAEEMERAAALIPVVEAYIKIEAEKAGKDLDTLLEDEAYRLVFISVVVDVVARTLMTSTNKEPMTQESQSALGYSWSGTFLVPGGGLFIKNAELARLGLRRQKYGVVDFYGEA